jgi:O-antigen/teichoic acid export membrane protein
VQISAVLRAHDAPPVPSRKLSRRALLNAVASALDYLARVVVELILNPILLAGLGSYLFGAWRVLWQWTGYVWATSGRSSQALQFVIAKQQHSSDVEEKRRYVASAVLVWVMFLPVLLAVGGLGIWLAPHVLQAPPAYAGPVRAAAAVLVVDSLALTLLTVPRSVLQGENLGYKRMGLSASLVVFGGALTALAVRLDLGIVGVTGATLATTLLTGVLFWRITRRQVPWFGFARPTRATVRWFFGLSSWFLGWKMLMELMTASDVLILAGLASVELVAVYVLTKFVAEALNRFVAVVVAGVTPGLGGIIGAGDLTRAARVRGEMMALTWLISTVVGSGILVWNESFVRLWVGADHYAGPLATLLVTVMVVQFCLIRNDTYVIDATLNLRVKVIGGAVSTAVAIGLAMLLVGVFDLGIAGLCAGIVAGRLILSVLCPWQVARSLGHPLRRQVQASLRPATVTVAVFALALTAGQRLSAESWVSLIFASAATALIVTAVVLVAGLTRAQRARLTRRLRLLAGRAP